LLSKSRECARIVTLCEHLLTCYQELPTVINVRSYT